MRGALVWKSIDVSALIAEVADAANGATSVFVGTVRSRNDGRDVRLIEYSAYETMAEKEIGDIIREAGDKFRVEHIVVEHRLGEIAIGEASVAVVAAHPHRAPAIDAMRYAVEELKQRVPIWKLEHYADGSREWVSASSRKTA